MSPSRANLSPTLRLKGGRVIDPANKVDGILDVYIADGRIAALGSAPEGFRAAQEIDASGCIVCPGLVDLCARVREPGRNTRRPSPRSRWQPRAAASPRCAALLTPTVVETPADIELIRRRAETVGKTRIVTLGALTHGLDGERLSEMAALKNAGCVGVSNALRPLANTLVQRRALEYAATFDLTVFLHADDHWLSANGCAHEGRVATRLGLPGIPEAAETAAVARDLTLIEQTGIRAHFCHLTTARAVHMVARAQFDGLPVTADAAIPYLYLTEVDLSDFDSRCHVIPPLRTTEDRLHLRGALQRGTLSAICSDHQPMNQMRTALFPVNGTRHLGTRYPAAAQFAPRR
jgi:dihydroorotase